MGYEGRKIEGTPAVLERLDDKDVKALNVGSEAGSENTLVNWLEREADFRNLRWLLAHADDGVIWGRVDKDATNQTVQLKTSSRAAPNVSPPLRLRTLQAARLFSSEAELLIWRDGDSHFQARVISDVATSDEADWIEAFDERQMVWGTHGKSLPEDFTLLTDGAQGLRHAVPLATTINAKGETNPPRLVVRHYLNREGFARVVTSRLVGFEEQSQ
jgi:CRISPR-associated protein (TIGR03984 family)